MSDARWREGVMVTKQNHSDWTKVVIKTIKKTNKALLLKLAKSMKARVLAVLQNRGGPTRF